MLIGLIERYIGDNNYHKNGVVVMIDGNGGSFFFSSNRLFLKYNRP